MDTSVKLDEMSDAHRQLLQSFMSRGIIDAREVRRQFEYACQRFTGAEVEANMDNLVKVITAINNNIRPMHLEIKKAVSEDKEGHFYGLVNTVESDITRLSSIYSVTECEFFKKLIENVVESENGSLSIIDALNLVSSLPDGVKMTISEAESLVKKMKDEKWLLETDGQISLSTRTLLEMEGYIREQHGDSVISCEMCKKLCLKGQTCSRCDVKLHYGCARRLFKNQPRPQCPNKNCGTDWEILERPRDASTSRRGTDSAGMDEDSEPRRSRRR